MKKTLLIILGICVATILVSVRYQIVLNTTSSMPYGFYLLNKQDHTLTRGSIVLACLNNPGALYIEDRGEQEHGFCPLGTPPIIKIAVAIPGDLVIFSKNGVSVNHSAVLPNSRPVASFVDNHGHRVMLPIFPYGHYRIPLGKFWLWTPKWYSFDSRYYGPLAVNGILHPIKIWTSTESPIFHHVLFRM